ncbi:MAG: AzlD domain-containing protein [Lachnospiraceae bacterium]|nr:AzlD domain-containing protein [Lachnospiraceae bacterium]
MIYVYIATMAITTYLIRMLPLVVFKNKIENRFIKSFLYYVPYACLMAMTFPAILYATDNMLTAFIGTIVAIILSLLNCGLVVVAIAACLAVFIASLIL